MGKIFQNELMVEIYFKSLVKAIGKVLCMKFSYSPRHQIAVYGGSDIYIGFKSV